MLCACVHDHIYVVRLFEIDTPTTNTDSKPPGSTGTHTITSPACSVFVARRAKFGEKGTYVICVSNLNPGTRLPRSTAKQQHYAWAARFSLRVQPLQELPPTRKFAGTLCHTTEGVSARLQSSGGSMCGVIMRGFVVSTCRP